LFHNLDLRKKKSPLPIEIPVVDWQLPGIRIKFGENSAGTHPQLEKQTFVPVSVFPKNILRSRRCPVSTTVEITDRSWLQ
jgi:hypothetical protein